MFVPGLGYGFLPYEIRQKFYVCLTVAVFAMVMWSGDVRANVHSDDISSFIPSNEKNLVGANASGSQPRLFGHLILPIDLGAPKRSERMGKPVRLAQANFDYTGFGRQRRYSAPSGPKIKIYSAPKIKVVKPPKPFFGIGSKKNVRRHRAINRQVGISDHAIIRGSDGRYYRVIVKRKRIGRHVDGSRVRPRPRTFRLSGYRTMCVRTCDGYYFPVSNGTSRSRLHRDSNICKSSCGVPAKLFYYRNGGGSIKSMVDLRGKKYSSMKFAFKYRKKVVNECRCKEQPWALSEIIRHEQYVAEELDRGIKRVKLVKVSKSVFASASVQLLDRGDEAPEDATENKEPKKFALLNRRTAAVQIVDGAKSAEQQLDKPAVNEAKARGQSVEEKVIDEQPLVGDKADVESLNQPAVIKGKVIRRRKHARRQRYRHNSNQIKKWWRSNRY